jgi:acyl carrier protein
VTTEGDETLSKVAEAIRDLFDDYEGPVTRETSAADIEQWDSLANVQLMVMIEQSLGVRFTTAEIQGFKNVGDLVDGVDSKKVG